VSRARAVLLVPVLAALAACASDPGSGEPLVAAEAAQEPPRAHAPVEPPPSQAHPIERAAELLAAVVPHVEAACGAEFRTPPRVRVLTPTEAREVFSQDMFAEIERRYAGATPGQRATVLQMAASASVKSCVARYSFSLGGIVLVRDGFDRQRKAVGLPPERAYDLLVTTLAHECVHALDDRRFSLGAIYSGAPDDEALRARAMVAEGRAVCFGRIAAARMGIPADVRNILPGGDAPRGVRGYTLNLTYGLGARFIGALLERGGVELADSALRDPPALTHQVCQPDRWPDRTGETAGQAILAKAGFTEGVHALSELQLRAKYAALLGRERADELFDGFRGGAQVLTADTNLAVLTFAANEDATRYADVAGADAPTRAHGSTVIRAFGPAAAALQDGVQAALPEPR